MFIGKIKSRGRNGSVGIPNKTWEPYLSRNRGQIRCRTREPPIKPSTITKTRVEAGVQKMNELLHGNQHLKPTPAPSSWINSDNQIVEGQIHTSKRKINTTIGCLLCFCANSPFNTLKQQNNTLGTSSIHVHSFCLFPCTDIPPNSTWISNTRSPQPFQRQPLTQLSTNRNKTTHPLSLETAQEFDIPLAHGCCCCIGGGQGGWCFRDE